jgi:hypothetical protein
MSQDTVEVRLQALQEDYPSWSIRFTQSKQNSSRAAIATRLRAPTNEMIGAGAAYTVAASASLPDQLDQLDDLRRQLAAQADVDERFLASAGSLKRGILNQLCIRAGNMAVSSPTRAADTLRRPLGNSLRGLLLGAGGREGSPRTAGRCSGKFTARPFPFPPGARTNGPFRVIRVNAAPGAAADIARS